MSLFRKPIIATPATTHSDSSGLKYVASSSRSAGRSSLGTRARERATAIVARSCPVNGAPLAESTCATFSVEAPRRSAKEQVWAEQYGQSAARLAAYMPSPTTSTGGPPRPKSENGRLRKLGTRMLQVRNAGGQISRYSSHLGTTPMITRTSSRRGP